MILQGTTIAHECSGTYRTFPIEQTAPHFNIDNHGSVTQRTRFKTIIVFDLLKVHFEIGFSHLAIIPGIQG